MMLFGWNMKQWAIVIGNGEAPKSLNEALDLQARYKTKNRFDPCEKLTIVVDGDDPRPMNLSAAYDLFLMVEI